MGLKSWVFQQPGEHSHGELIGGYDKWILCLIFLLLLCLTLCFLRASLDSPPPTARLTQNITILDSYSTIIVHVFIVYQDVWKRIVLHSSFALHSEEKE